MSLVVAPADRRKGLPPQARALLDRSGRLGQPLPADRWTPDAETQREWAFLAWVSIGDAARHAVRGHTWRALRSLTEARDQIWQLWAADSDVVYPAFGVVSVENADLPAPPGLDTTHPADLEPATLIDAAEALGRILSELRTDLPDLAASIRRRIDALRAARAGSSPMSPTGSPSGRVGQPYDP